jgi:hypothetical protein
MPHSTARPSAMQLSSDSEMLSARHIAGNPTRELQATGSARFPLGEGKKRHPNRVHYSVVNPEKPPVPCHPPHMPEPTSTALIAMGLAAAAVLRRPRS